MEFKISHNNKIYSADLSKPIDISIPLRAGENNPTAFYALPVKMEAMKSGSFIGDVNQGGSCNVNDIFFNPHCHGTHTECVGHISKEKHSLNQSLKEFFFLAQLITVTPEEINGDKIITKEQVLGIRNQESPSALIIRTIPNDKTKLTRNYSGTNPPYLHHEAAKWICENNIEHLLLDLPSVDREDDGGKLLAHHAFWNYPQATREHCTISELIFVSENIPDGFYLLNLMIASFENDASPSKPILYLLK
jgi:arylformamidase